MTVQNTIVKNVYVGNGSTTVFPFTFECNKAEHIQAFVKDAVGNISSTTNFKVNLDQKNVTYPNTGEPLPDGYKLIILRQLPLQQLLNLLNQGPFYAEDIEETFDEVVMMLQQMTERIGRSLAVSIDIDAENSFNTIIPLEAGKTFRVKEDGTGFEVTEDPGKVIDGAKALLKLTTEQAEFAKEQADASNQSAANAQIAANAAEAVAPEYAKTKEVLDNIVSYTNTATEQAGIATAKADAANTSATNAAQSYSNANAVAAQLTEYLATKETLTAPAVDKTLLINGAAADAKVVGDRLVEVSSSTRAVSELVKEYHTKEVSSGTATREYIGVLLASGYVLESGSVATARQVSTAIPIPQGSKYISLNYNFSNHADTAYYCTMGFYSKVGLASKVFMVEDSIENGMFVKIPEGASYVRIGGMLEDDLSYGFYTEQSASTIVEQLYGKGAYTVKGNMIDGTKFTIPTTNLKNNHVYTFMCNVNTFDTLIIGHGKTDYQSSYVTITNTDISVTNYLASATTRTWTHGLAIKDFLYVKIKVGLYGQADIYLQTNAADDYEYKVTITGWRGISGDSTDAMPFAESIGSILTDCNFTWSSAEFRKQVWAFGDSYFEVHESRWGYYMKEDGFYDNILWNGYGGENSPKAFTAFSNSIEYFGKPKYVLWALGMNDDNDTDVAIGANWLENIEKVKELCSQHGIILIMCTIPTVANKGNIKNHELKNNYVRNSGYRYVDCAKAVGADASGVWYDGMLSSDEQHPDVKGGKALYMKFITDMPELTF